ncbi:MAG: hypothetical protein Q8Q86_01715, partial [Candidatus Daviesbacteria bacterium]|nr:hypothetical protein [Candidatus Daviesbacteria bacterium]
MKKLTVYCLLFTAMLIIYHLSFITPTHAAQTREEWSVSQFKQGSLPEQLTNEKTLKEQNALDQVFDVLKSIPGFFIKIFKEEPLKKGTFLT